MHAKNVDEIDTCLQIVILQHPLMHKFPHDVVLYVSDGKYINYIILLFNIICFWTYVASIMFCM
jgi:hypothetical protein